MSATDRRAELIALLARVMTLPNASVVHGHPPKYYGIRRARYKDHVDPLLRFPEPLRATRGAEEFDVVELALWDARRRQATPIGRAMSKERDSE